MSLKIFKIKILLLSFLSTVVMSQIILNKRSESNLESVHPHLVKIVRETALITNTNFVVIEGLRSYEQQKINFKKGVSWTMRSKHLKQSSGYSHAVDIAIIRNGKFVTKLEPYDELSREMKQVAKRYNVCIIYGGDWRVRDAMHYELCQTLLKPIEKEINK